MSYEFKKLSEVEALTEVPEGAKVLAESNGQIVRVPGSGLGGSGGGVFIVNITATDQGNDSYIYESDKTLEELTNAHYSGLLIVGRLIGAGIASGMVFCEAMLPVAVYDGSEGKYVELYGIGQTKNLNGVMVRYIHCVTFNNSNTPTYKRTYFTIAEAPNSNIPD